MFAAWSLFLACSGLIAIAGFWLARYGDVIAEKTQLGGTWIGVILVATVTSLPELVTGISSVTLADAPDIAVGDVLGSCVFNLALVAVLDFLHRETPIYRTASHGHILSAGFSIMLPVLCARYGGWGFLASRLPPEMLSWDGGVGVQSILVWYVIASATMVEPAFYQRCYAARSSATARNGILLSIVFWSLFDFMTTFTVL